MNPEATGSRTSLHRRIRPFRTGGMALGGVPMATVLYLQGAPPGSWLFLAFTALLWPQLAWLLARRSADPYRAEIRNLLVDSALAGAWVPLMHFSLLPGALLLTLTTVDKISTGIRGLWLRSLPGMLLAMAAATLVTGGAFDPETPMPVILACLPVLLIHTTSVALGSYRLIRKVGLQNRELDRLHRTDSLTGLSGRADWERHAAELLREQAPGGAAACLLLIDIDEFKRVNDRHGHAAGDEVLRAIGATVGALLRSGDRAGRIGGDELVVLLPSTPEPLAIAVAERLRSAVEAIRLDDYPDVRPTVSIGVAGCGASSTLRDWFNAADRALYRAKDGGRNRVVA
ncbi:diguanylate cyclase [Luteimonas sp. RD2P54]|uniref:diguanylate cyclase n=1 Tax=Luteimonas endophytica TaxID=3042023 RepID=A0ABT6JAQ8_9GAMM|nr:diguanylate cyclase [Luteimonas endophytica]MDH5823687.1 diguanylate cyclase [Luteimonas endophytica]